MDTEAVRTATVPASYHAKDRPLCVDLDGTILATDLLWEMVFLLLRRRPRAALFALPFWLLHGKAYFKRQLANRVKVNAAGLPYRKDVLDYLRQERLHGRSIVLVTAADSEAIRPVVEHLDLFSDVLASDGHTNLSGKNKASVLVDRFGSQGFDYVGNDSKDLDAWKAANSAILVDAAPGLLRTARRSLNTVKVFPRKSRLRPAIKALRAYQWSKNVLVFVPVAMAHRVFEFQPMLQALLAFVALSLCASSVYVLNDLLDLDADRLHPKKKARPFAAGTLPIPLGLCMMAALLVGGVSIAALLPLYFALMLMLYVGAAIAYSLYIKKLVIADIIALSGLYTLRVLAGGVAPGVPISFWLLAFSMFLFLSLAFMKRYIELTLVERQGLTRAGARAYYTEDLYVLQTMGMIASFMSVLVLAFFINSREVTALYRRPEFLWMVCPALMYWIVRMWFRAHRGSFDDDDPIVDAFKDKVSYIVAVLVGVFVILAK